MKKPDVIEEPKRLSYSSLSSYAECGQRWLLSRGYGLDKATWYTTVLGSALHNITELEDRKELGERVGRIPSLKKEFDRLLKEEEEKGREVKASGRLTKEIGKSGGPNKKDYDWCLHFGPIFLGSWSEWKASANRVLALTPDGRPAIEIKLDQPIGGEVHLGFIDRIYINMDTGEFEICDLKTGNEPASILQLGAYRVGVRRQFDWDITTGFYWMAPKGDISGPFDLTHFTEEYIDDMYAQAWTGIRSGVFLPHVTSMCNGCGVKPWCRAKGGEFASTIPTRVEVVPRDGEGVGVSSQAIQSDT